MRSILTFVLGLVTLAIGSAFFLVGLWFQAAGAFAQGQFLGPISGALILLGSVLAVGAIAKGS